MASSPKSDLTPHHFHILLALADDQRHGSAIVREVLRLTDGRLRLWPATLYGALEHMVSAGWIRESSPDERPEGESEKRRYYRICPEGERLLGAEARRMAALAEAAFGKLADRTLGAT